MDGEEGDVECIGVSALLDMDCDMPMGTEVRLV